MVSLYTAKCATGYYITGGMIMTIVICQNCEAMIDVKLVRIPAYFYWVFAVCPECGRVAYEYYHYPKGDEDV